MKAIEALGALKLMSGGSASLAAVDDLHQATGRDLNLVVGQKHNATVCGDMQERIKGVRQSAAMISQRYESPRTWIGSSGLNVLTLLCELIDLVKQMNAQLASHTHGPSPIPVGAETFSVNADRASDLKLALRNITL